MSESLPLELPRPRRIGNELLCRPCAAGRCVDCAALQYPPGWCEHACAHLARLRAVPNLEE